jgi:Fic family protein
MPCLGAAAFTPAAREAMREVQGRLVDLTMLDAVLGRAWDHHLRNRLDSAQGRFEVTFSKSLYTVERLHNLGLNERQIWLIHWLKEHLSTTNKAYREHWKLSDETAWQDLNELVQMGLLVRSGLRRSAAYALRKLASWLAKTWRFWR